MSREISSLRARSEQIHLASIRSMPAIVALMCGLALAVRLVAIAVVGPNPAITNYSESGIIARNLFEGLGYTYDFYGLRSEQPLQAYVPPLYVGLIYLCLHLPDPPLALALTQAALSSLVPAAIYLIAQTLSGKRTVALLAALAAALYPVSVLTVTVPHTMTIHMTVLTWAVALTVLLLRPVAWGWAVAAGVLWGLAILGRPALLVFLAFVVLWLWLNRTAGERAGRPLLWGGLLVLAAGLTILPWTTRNYIVLGQLVPVSANGGSTFWNGNNPFTTGSGHEVYTAKVDEFLGRPHDPNQPAVALMQPYPLPLRSRLKLAP